MGFTPQWHAGWGDHPDVAVSICHDHALHGGYMQAGGVEELGHTPGLGEAVSGLDRCVLACERCPSQGHNVAVLRDIIHAVRQCIENRAIACFPDCERFILAQADPDCFLACCKVLPSLRGAVLAGCVGVHFFDHEILCVRSRVGETPRNVVIAAENDRRDAGDGDADDVGAIGAHMGGVPDGRSEHSQMRIIGEERFTALCPGSVHDPVV